MHEIDVFRHLSLCKGRIRTRGGWVETRRSISVQSDLTNISDLKEKKKNVLIRYTPKVCLSSNKIKEVPYSVSYSLL